MCTACVLRLHACSLPGTTYMPLMHSSRCCAPSELSMTWTYQTDMLRFYPKHCVLHEEVVSFSVMPQNRPALLHQPASTPSLI